MVFNAIATDEIDYKFSSDAIAIDVPSSKEARALVSLFSRNLAISALKFGRSKVVVRYPGGIKPYQIPAKLGNKGVRAMTQGAIVATPELAISEMMISAPFLRVLAEMLERPDERATIVRVSDERQIVVSASLAPLIASASPTEATKRKREDYWHLADLEDFRRDWRQYLEPNNPESTREISFACCDPVTKGNWRQMTNRYRAVEVNGQLYHYSVNVGCEPMAAAPV